MSLLALIADNQLLFDELKACLTKQFSLDALDTTLSNEEIGARVRARLDGLKAVEDAFREIATYKTKTGAEKPQNPAR